MKAVITVLGKDRIGILAKISALCAENNINVEEVTQSILQGMFAMTMIVDMSKCEKEITEVAAHFAAEGDALGLEVRVTRSELYTAMHHV